MEIIVKLRDVVIEHDPKLVEHTTPSGEKALTYYGRILTLGDTIRVRNPQKYDGKFSEVLLEARVDQGAKSFREKSGYVSASIVRTIRFGSIVEAKQEAKPETKTSK